MTPEQRLQEAKDQAARELGFSDFGESIHYTHPKPIYERAAHIMYEAGKKESDVFINGLKDHIISLENQVKFFSVEASESKEESERFRKALEKTEIELLNLSTRLQSFSLSFRTGRLHQIIDIIQDALNNKP